VCVVCGVSRFSTVVCVLFYNNVFSTRVRISSLALNFAAYEQVQPCILEIFRSHDALLQKRDIVTFVP
jgi:hypothetical protein